MPLWISHATPSYTHFSLCTLPSALYLITLSLKFSYKKKWKWIKSGRDHHLHRTIIDRTGEVENLSCFWLGQELGIDQGGRRGKWFWGVVAPQQKVSWGNTARLLNPPPFPLLKQNKTTLSLSKVKVIFPHCFTEKCAVNSKMKSWTLVMMPSIMTDSSQFIFVNHHHIDVFRRTFCIFTDKCRFKVPVMICFADIERDKSPTSPDSPVRSRRAEYKVANSWITFISLRIFVPINFTC